MDHQYAMSMVKQNGLMIRMIPDDIIDSEIRATAIARTPSSIQYMKNLTDAEIEAAIDTQGEIDRDGIFDLLELAENVSQELLGRTIRYNGNCIKLITDPTYDQLTTAVNTDGDAIKHIEEPDVELQRLAISSDLSNAKFINNIDDEIVTIMMDKNPRSLEWVKKPSRDHQRRMLRELPDDGIHYLNDIDEDLAIRHITDHPEQIEIMVNQTEECCWAALNVDGSFIKKIRSPTPEMVGYAKLVSDGSY